MWDAGDLAFGWGDAASTPVVGDWSGDGKTKVGTFKAGTFWLDMDGNTVWSIADKQFTWGTATSVPVVGDWNGDGITKVGCFTAGTWKLDQSGTFAAGTGFSFPWGVTGDKLIVGRW